MEEYKTKLIFVWIISICGCILVFLSPPLSVPDEHTHFLNAYSLSEMNFWPDKDENTLVVGKYIPKYIVDFTQKYRENYAMRLEEGYSFSESYFDSWLPVNDIDREPIFWASDLVAINPLGYIVSAIGIKIVSIFCHIGGGGFDTAYNLMLAGRLSNLLFYVLVGYWAINITPCLKKTMMLVLGMPMSIYLAASLSYDAILIPVSMLFFAEFMKLYIGNENSEVNVKDMITIAFCVLFLVSVKIVCAPFILLLLLIPRVKFKSLKQYIISIGIVVAVGIIALLPVLISKILVQGINEITNPNVLAQKEYLYKHIFLIPTIIGNTFIQYSNFYLSGFVGKLGQLDTNFPILYIGIFWVVLLIMVAIESCNIRGIDWKLRLATPIIILIIISGMFIKMYTSYTPLVEEPFGKTVSGIQGRYFIPVFCYLFIILFNNFGKRVPFKIANKISPILKNITLFFIVQNCLLTILIVLVRYWH